MFFAHMADCHIGGWREPKISELAIQSFEKAIDETISLKVDFVIIAGDIFNTAVPGIENIKRTVKKLKELKKAGIPCYIIPGSHDFSASGKTMLDVLEEAELCVNVMKGEVKEGKLNLKFTEDKKTGAKLTGILGKKGMLEKKHYEQLNKEALEKETGTKIFLFHTSITELKPKELEKMDSYSASFLPKNFNYYAGGHVHITEDISLENYNRMVYPGPLFPANFRELEQLKSGKYVLVKIEGNRTEIERRDIILKQTLNINIDCENKSPFEVEKAIREKLDSPEDKIILIRLSGTLREGKPSDINFKEIYEEANSKNAFFIMRNTSQLKSKEFKEVKVEEGTAEEIEEKIIKEHAGQIALPENFNEEELAKQLIKILSSEKLDGEKVSKYEERIMQETDSLFKNLNKTVKNN